MSGAAEAFLCELVEEMAYGASPITRCRRRTAAEIDAIKAAIYNFCWHEKPVAVRQTYYHLTTRGLIQKTEGEYNSTVVRLMAQMRRDGDLPYGWVADNTRWMRRPRTYGSLAEAVQQTAEFYRRRLWDEQDIYAEVWCEKDSLSGVLYPVTAAWDVPLMPTRGYPSLTFLHSAAEQIANVNKPAILFYLGDHDPSGVDIPRKIESEIGRLAPEADFELRRLAVNLEQIKQWNLPTRPTKKTDTRAKSFKGESVEVDAIAPSRLREMVKNEILSLVDSDALQRAKAAEDSERALLQAWAQQVEGARP